MTREEIIDFCDMKAQLEPENEDIFKAIIKALEQESIFDKIRAEIEQLPTTLIDVQRPHSVVERDVVELGSVLKIIDKYKAKTEDKE